ncbi:MAG: TlpA disulfide reductase family protein [Candidatus Kapaibacterium sp.]
MKNILLLLVILIIATQNSLSEDGAKYITGKITLADGSDAKKEVFVYSNRDKAEKWFILDTVNTNSSGEFKYKIPDYQNYLELHLASPGYEAYITRYIGGDINPRVEAVLSKRGIPQIIDSVDVFISAGRRDVREATPFNKKLNQDNFSFQVNLNTDTFSKISPKDLDTIGYYLVFNDDITYTPNSHIGEWDYDHNGDYKAVRYPIDNKIDIDVDFSKYRVRESDIDSSLTAGKWVNSPINTKYNEILKLLPVKEIFNIDFNYYVFVRQVKDEYLKDYTPEYIDSMKISLTSLVNRFKGINDSLLKVIKTPILNDYLKVNKLYLMQVTDTSSNHEFRMEVFNSINEFPYLFYDVIDGMLYRSEFLRDPKSNVAIVEKMFNKIESNTERTSLKNRFYYSLSRTKVAFEPEGYDFIIDKINDYISEEDLSESQLDGMNRTIEKLDFMISKIPPKLEFKSIDDKHYKLSDFAGKWVLLDFWGTWCGPCVAETPNLIKAYEMFKDKGLEIIGIANDRGVDVIKEYSKKNNIKWTQTIQMKGYIENVLKDYKITAFPTMMLINPQGEFDTKVQSELRGESLIETLKQKIGK